MEKSSSCLDTAWRHYVPELRAWMRRRLSQPQDVDDMMQDLFIKAMNQGGKFCDIVNARAWLYEVARNAIADRMKVKREMVELPDDLVSQDEDVAVVDMLTACLPRVLSELNDADRDALVKCDIEGMSQAVFAEKMGINLSTAKSRLQRARQKLRERMSSACQVKLDELGHVQDFVPRPTLDPSQVKNY